MTGLAPLHVAVFDERPLRFYCSPCGRVAVPWVALCDLLAAQDRPFEGLPTTIEAIRTDGFFNDCIGALTVTGPVLIVSGSTALGILGGVVEGSQARAGLAAAYGVGLGAAVDRLLAGLPAEQRGSPEAMSLAEGYGLESRPDPDGPDPSTPDLADTEPRA